MKNKYAFQFVKKDFHCKVKLQTPEGLDGTKYLNLNFN